MALRQRSFRKTFLIMSIYINPHIKCPPKITGRIMIELILGLIRLNTCLPGKMHTGGCVLRVCLHAFMGIKLHKSDRGRRKSSLNLLASMKFNFSNQFLQAIVVWSFTELFTLNLSHWFSVCQKCKWWAVNLRIKECIWRLMIIIRVRLKALYVYAPSANWFGHKCKRKWETTTLMTVWVITECNSRLSRSTGKCWERYGN